jgi:SAM-dependent methyltransferase
MLCTMDWNDPQQRSVFFEVHQDLPREAPGSRACTRRALAVCREAAGGMAPTTVLDIGCGPGAQTLDLAEQLPAARFVAIDLHQPFLQALQSRSRLRGLSARITPVRADMSRLPARSGVWDLVWCEGAAYIVGVAAALESWRPLLRPGGVAAFTDAVWLSDSPPEAARTFWAEYADMLTLPERRRQVIGLGWEILGDFVLPPAAWWDDYYRPMLERIEGLRVTYQGDAVAMAVLEECQAEVDVFRRHGDSYGYAFFVARPGGGGRMDR